MKSKDLKVSRHHSDLVAMIFWELVKAKGLPVTGTIAQVPGALSPSTSRCCSTFRGSTRARRSTSREVIVEALQDAKDIEEDIAKQIGLARAKGKGTRKCAGARTLISWENSRRWDNSRANPWQTSRLLQQRKATNRLVYNTLPKCSSTHECL